MISDFAETASVANLKDQPVKMHIVRNVRNLDAVLSSCLSAREWATCDFYRCALYI
jgi:hypothetical protein